MHTRCIGGLVFVLLFFSCNPISFTRQGSQLEAEHEASLAYSMVFIIHGDNDYLYHDAGGNAHIADEDALIEAIKVAVQNPQAEVFIFHERQKTHTMLFFPKPDGNFYYFRSGRLIAKEQYMRDHGPSRFDPVKKLYQRFRALEHPRLLRLFLYFGHEIPEFNGSGYDASYPHKEFTVHDLADGLKGITPDSTKFDLIVLSTCFNGTPHTIATLAPFARTIIASPANLHLSYFNLQPFTQLDVGLQDGAMTAFSETFARKSFERLAEDLQTAVSVAVYDVDRVQKYLFKIGNTYDQTLTTLMEQKAGSFEHCDCAEDSTYVVPGMSEGVDIFYRPPRFGRQKNRESHSGWQCWRLLK